MSIHTSSSIICSCAFPSLRCSQRSNLREKTEELRTSERPQRSAAALRLDLHFSTIMDLHYSAIIHTLSPEHVPEPSYRLPRTGCSPGDLAHLPWPFAKGGIPRAAVDVVPDRLARRAGHRVDRYRALDASAHRLRAHPGDGRCLGGPLCARRLRGLQGEPGRRLPLPHSRRRG